VILQLGALFNERKNETQRILVVNLLSGAFSSGEVEGERSRRIAGQSCRAASALLRLLVLSLAKDGNPPGHPHIRIMKENLAALEHG